MNSHNKLLPTTSIRPIKPSDHAEWLRLREALWPDQSPAQNAQEMSDILSHFAEMPVFVAERPDGKLCGLMEVAIHTTAPGCTTNKIGFLEGWYRSPEKFCPIAALGDVVQNFSGKLYVDPDCRGQGVGRQLVEAAEAWAIAQGCVEMASDTDGGYPISPAAHAQLGYQEVHRDIYFRKALVES